MITFTTFVLWLHLTAISFWVGGLFAVSFVSTPVVNRGLGTSAEARRMVSSTIRRFLRISREVLLLILLTGAFNIINAGVARQFTFGASYLLALGIKLGLFAGMVALQVWQGVSLAPALEAIPAGAPPEAAGSLLRRLTWTSAVMLVMAAGAILLGLGLRYQG